MLHVGEGIPITDQIKVNQLSNKQDNSHLQFLSFLYDIKNLVGDIYEILCALQLLLDFLRKIIFKAKFLLM